MKITVLNGSPKGMQSVTMQYMKYLQNLYSECSFSFFSVANTISSIEKDPDKLRDIAEKVKSSDLVFWAFPLYYMLCCSQYKRFIELVFEREAECFKGVPAAVLTTSIKFYDHTAINYIRGVCDDLGMPFCGAYSAESSDLFKEEEQKRLSLFMESVLNRNSENTFFSRLNNPLEAVKLRYHRNLPGEKVCTAQGKWLVLADLETEGDNLGQMVSEFVDSTGKSAELIDISRLDFPPCTGCCRCAFDNECIFGEDDYIKLHREKVREADVIVIAGEIRDRYLSSTWKKFFDRSFYAGHTPSLKGKQLGFLISGEFGKLKNLQEILTAWTEFQQCGLAGFVSDEHETSEEISSAVQGLVKSLNHGVRTGYIPPGTFRMVGGSKLFRDAVWGPLRPIFQADHKYYRKNGYYNFPQNRIGNWLTNIFVAPVLRLPPVKEKVKSMMPGAMISRFKRIVS